MACTKMSDEKKLVEAPKADVVLSDGREVFFDFDKVTYGEIHGVFDRDDTKLRTDETIGKSAGMSLDEVYAMTGKDYKLFTKAFVNKWINWQADPND